MSKPGLSSKKKRSKTICCCPIVADGHTNTSFPRIVLDEGTEFEVIVSVGWRVLDMISKTANMGGWRAGMTGPTLPIVYSCCDNGI
jgi:hypothetical protein